MRLVTQEGQRVVSTDEARRMAEQANLDLVEIVPNERPPVCRIVDFGKYKYEQSRKQKEHKPRSVDWKEIQLSPVIDPHDLETKINHLKSWLEKGKHVRVVLKFKGRQLAHVDDGRAIMEKVISAVTESARIESKPRMDGKSFIAHLAPK